MKEIKQDSSSTEENPPEAILTKELVAKYSHAWWIYRINIGYMDDVYRLEQDVARLKMNMPKDRPKELRDLLGKAFKALEKEEQDLTNLYGGQLMRLLEICDERGKEGKKEVEKWKKSRI